MTIRCSEVLFALIVFAAGHSGLSKENTLVIQQHWQAFKRESTCSTCVLLRLEHELEMICFANSHSGCCNEIKQLHTANFKYSKGKYLSL